MPSPVHTHMHDKIPSVGACGILRGWLSTRMEANPVGNPRQRSTDGVVRAYTRSAIGPIYHVHGWRAGDAYPLSAVLLSMW